LLGEDFGDVERFHPLPLPVQQARDLHEAA
jgi:hypothetical protein